MGHSRETKGRKEKITGPKSSASFKLGIWYQVWNRDGPWTSESLRRAKRNWLPQQRALGVLSAQGGHLHVYYDALGPRVPWLCMAPLPREVLKIGLKDFLTDPYFYSKMIIFKTWFKKKELGRLGGSVGWASDFSSGHDLTLHGFESHVRLCADSSRSLFQILCLLLSLPLPTLMLSVSLSKNE